LGYSDSFGTYGSSQRRHILDNFVMVVITEQHPHIHAMQWLPDPSRRHQRGAQLLLFMHGRSSIAFNTHFSFRILS